MGSLSKASRGCVGWALVLVIAAVVVAAAVTTFVYHQKNKKTAAGGSPSPSHSKPPTSLGSAAYSQALQLSLSFFDVQKSGKLPADNPIEWRHDSALKDGHDVGVDLTGGLYDAGDHIKFGLPLAFTCTLLSWSVLEYGAQMESVKQLDAAKSSIKWITDYLIKTHTSSNELYFQVGDPQIDHACWQRPEDMDEARPLLKLNASMPGSEVAGEVAAAMTAASLVFRSENSTYSDELLKHAQELFEFATTHMGSYSDSYPSEQTYYNSTGYEDELLWASAWLFHATGEEKFLSFVTGVDGEKFAGWVEAPAWLSWDNKLPGVQVLLSRYYLLHSQTNSMGADAVGLQKYGSTADELMCALLPDSPTKTDKRTDAGLIWVIEWNSLQHAVNSALLALLYSDYLYTAKAKGLSCSGQMFSSEDLRNFAMSQANYILGQNPLSMSYLVGYTKNYPKQVHHRAASIPMDNVKYGCKDGFEWLSSPDPNPNSAIGALVGGPFQNDTFTDSRNNTMQNEPTTYNSAAMVGLTAGLISTSQVTVSDKWA